MFIARNVVGLEIILTLTYPAEFPLDGCLVKKHWIRYCIVNSSDPKHLLAGTRIETFRSPPALGSYIMKYASKMEQKDVPKEFESVGRFWGTWGKS
jgi:hypothetical protein